MNWIAKSEICKKISAILLAAIIVFSSIPLTVFAAPVVDIDANGQDALTLATSTDSFVITLATTDATACDITSPASLVSGVSVNTSFTISPGDASYPTIGGSTTFTVICNDALGEFASDSVVVSLPAVVIPPVVPAPTIDVKVNGSDGPVTLNSTDTYTYSWTSTDAIACDQTNPVTSGVSFSGTSSVIDSSNTTFFPSTSTPITISITCTNTSGTSTDSVIVNLSSGPVVPPTGGGVSVDVKVNGSDGPVSINNGDTYTYTWVSSNATACDQTSPLVSGISFSGTSSTIDPSNTAFYPSTSTPITISITCTNATSTSTDSVVVSLNSATTTTPTSPSTPTGGGGGGGRRRTSPVAPVEPLACPLISTYMRIDLPNDPVEVMKLQAFLKVFEGFDYVNINGVFDQATFDAVSAFQSRYEGDILNPWGEPGPTGYVYILTLKKVNEIYCKTVYDLSQAQIDEINNYRALRESGDTTIDLPIVGVADEEGAPPTDGLQGQIQQFALAVFSFPDTLKDKLQCLYELGIIIFVLYMLGTMLRDVLYKDVAENVFKRFASKWATYIVGLLIAIITAYALEEYCLLLPLLILTTASIIWVTLYTKHNSIRATLKSWILVIRARLKR